ncbi:MAG: cohesin domain-containing protein [Candidatus Methanoperedens sp.]|nr:cohesin domain-containing protein [Candidatus Methanoperedens sp.]
MSLNYHNNTHKQYKNSIENNNDYKFNSLKLILLITALFLIPHSLAADVIVSPSNKIINQGQAFELDINLDPTGTPVAGAQLNIAYNKSLLKINSIKEGNVFKIKGSNTFFNAGTINNSNGMVVNIFDAILGPSNVSTVETFIIINATSIGASGSSGIYLSNVKISDPDGKEVPVNIKNGSVIINTLPIPAPSPIPSPTPSPSPTSVPKPTISPILPPNPATTQGIIFFDDMETGKNLWISSGLWHITTNRSNSPHRSFWYGQEMSGNYDTGILNSGYLISPPINLSGVTDPLLSFISWYNTENGMTYDKKIIQISIDDGLIWVTMKQISDTQSQWNIEQIDISSYAGKTIKIRFYFDSIDSYYNNFEGWYVDNVKIESKSPNPTPTPAPDQGAIFFDDMETGKNPWVSSGLWHITTKLSNSPNKSFWYGQEMSGNYDTGILNSGALISPSISLTGITNPMLSFMSWYNTENGITYDKKIIQLSIDNGLNWVTLKQISDTKSQWNIEQIDISSYVGNKIKIRFYFDTIDSYYNTYEGWYVDNIKIESKAPTV